MAQSLKILQINLARSRSASAKLQDTCCDLSPHVLFLQEPYVFQNRIAGVSLADLVFFDSNHPKCAIVFRNFSHLQMNVFCLYTSSDLIVVRYNLLEQEIILINCYVSPNANLPSFLIRLEPFVRRYNA